jgi:hypothetical protein
VYHDGPGYPTVNPIVLHRFTLAGEG